MISRPTTCDNCKKLAYCECHLDGKKHPVCNSVGEREQREEEDHKAQQTARTGKKAPRERGGEEGIVVTYVYFRRLTTKSEQISSKNTIINYNKK
jgi:hypothetical protein